MAFLPTDGKLLLSTNDGLVRLNAATGLPDSSFGANGVISNLSGLMLAAAEMGNSCWQAKGHVSQYLSDGNARHYSSAHGRNCHALHQRPAAAALTMQFTPDGANAIGFVVGSEFGSSSGDSPPWRMVRLDADGFNRHQHSPAG